LVEILVLQRLAMTVNLPHAWRPAESADKRYSKHLASIRAAA
jgi:hypothetical protein